MKLPKAISYANYQLWLFAGLGALLWVFSPGSGGAPPRAVYEWAVARDPNFALGQRVLGDLDEGQHRDVEALDHYRAALAAEPFDHAVCMARGRVAQRLEHLDEALEAFRCTTEHDPANAEAHGRLGALLQRKGEVKPAADEFRRALALDDGDDQARLGLGVNLAMSGRLDEAAPLLELAAAHRPDDADATFNLGLLYRRQARVSEALALFEKTTRLDPHRTPAWANLVELELTNGQPQRAKEHLMQWLALEPENPAARQFINSIPSPETGEGGRRPGEGAGEH